MVQVLHEVVARIHLLQNIPCDFLMILKDLVECVGRQVQPCLDVKKLPEGESTKILGLHDAIKFRILILKAHHRRTCKHDSQSWILVVTLAELRTPIRLFENLVY